MQKQKWNVVFSVIFSVIIGWLENYFTTTSEYLTVSNLTSVSGKSVETIIHFGWPYRISFSAPYDASIMLKPLVINFIFWFLLAFIILSLIRHFKSKEA